jgi:hypothetical protein
LPLKVLDELVLANKELAIQNKEKEKSAQNIKIRTSYNLAGFTCTPEELYNTIKLESWSLYFN